MSEQLKPCDNPICDRKTGRSTHYCCLPCSMAAEGGYEIAGERGAHPAVDTHSEGCDKRQAERASDER